VESDKIRSVIESLLFISGEPLGIERMAQTIPGVDKKELRAALEELAEEYAKQGRGIRIAEVAGGYQLETAKENSEFLARLIKTRPIRLTKPSLETMAIIAYRQPVTRQEVDLIRGVDSSGVINTLLEFGFVQIVGRKDVPGRPFIYGTSKRFLEFFRLNSLGDLPSLDEFFAQAEERQAEESNLFEGRFQENPDQQQEHAEGAQEGEAAKSEEEQSGPEPEGSTE
jgi:segregation and condensation protein B